MTVAPRLQRSEFRAKGPNGVEGRYRVTSWDTSLGRVVMLTELDDNPGASVTNAVAWLIPYLEQALQVDHEDTIWIEHYPQSGLREPTFDRVRLVGATARWEPFPCPLLASILGMDEQAVKQL